ncbi:F-box protein At1g67130-like [Salvia splendens]|uniref:F-box protein At1g67130-like n=1 Tax=Salvia splendens TaxID=180675 RepID=UPI001C25CB4E|nr:F-box protein At1g67130-like [Salvia splendens]
MNQDFWRYLPSEIFINILSRLSLGNITTCKCVCKPWLNMIESEDFIKLDLSESSPVLVVSIRGIDSNWFNVFKLDVSIPVTASNWLNFFQLEAKHKHKQDPITKFDFPHASSIFGSANGLLLLKNLISNPSSDQLYVCNPITREFLELHAPCLRDVDGYGLGVSKISGQHKVVLLNPVYGCHVLTLETGSSWKPVFFLYECCCDSPIGAFVNGKLYWIVTKLWVDIHCICCFDVERERFSTFDVPVDAKRRDCIKWRLYALGDSLCFCDDEPYEKEIWKYEHVERCWSKIPFIVERPYSGLCFIFNKPPPF